jgi:hypothetical protein
MPLQRIARIKGVQYDNSDHTYKGGQIEAQKNTQLRKYPAFGDTSRSELIHGSIRDKTWNKKERLTRLESHPKPP